MEIIPDWDQKFLEVAQDTLFGNGFNRLQTRYNMYSSQLKPADGVESES